MGMQTISPLTSKLRSPLYVVGVASVLAVAVSIGLLFVANQQTPRSRIVAAAAAPTGTPNQSPEAPPASSPSTSPVAGPTAGAPSPVASSSLTPFVCGSTTISAQQAPATAYVNGVRTGSHSGYDRLTIQFSSGQPSSIDLRPQAGTAFIRSPRGDMVTLRGQSGIQVIIRGADEHTSYGGPTDLTPGGPSLREARQVEDFEGQVQWGLGLSGTGCYRAFILTNPTRLVIDAQAG
jgi:hypothetical protein